MSLRASGLWALVILVILGAVLATFQNRAASTGQVSPVQRPAIAILRPVESVLDAIGGMCSLIATEATQKAHLQAQRDDLQRQVAILTVQNIHLASIATENQRLRRLLSMTQHDPAGAHWIAADVVARRPSQWFDFVTLDRGSNAGVRQHSVVITAEGLVGQVVMMRSDSSDVELLTDSSSNAGAMVPRTHDVGYVHGTGGKDLVLSFFDRDHGARPGDVVVSSPFSALYPSGLRIGTIVSISAETGTTTRTAIVRSAVQFNDMEEAIVIP
jgi:rod shape-determining protein MreC